MLDERFRAPSKPKTLKENTQGIVILLDEIDKAEPDLPNDLLEPLDGGSFLLPDGGEVKAPGDLLKLVIITTNGERDLPPAFLRRCIHLEIQSPNSEALQRIAGFHFKENDSPRKQDVFDAVAEEFCGLVINAKETGRRPPGTSEFLDAVGACLEFGITPESDSWQQIKQAALSKQSELVENE